MCEWGKTVPMILTIPAYLSHSGEAYDKTVGIDRCIAPLVKALNDSGIKTVSSCCGHGKGHGNIALADGRELIIAADFGYTRCFDEMAQRIDELEAFIEAEGTCRLVPGHS